MARGGRRRAPGSKPRDGGAGGEAEAQAARAAALGAFANTNRRDPGQLNAYPFWKYLLIALVIGLGALYAAPNLYAPDPAVTIAPRNDSAIVSDAILGLATSALDDAGIAWASAAVEDDAGVIRFAGNEQQLQGREVVNLALVEGGYPDDFTVVLNLASTTPRWLEDIGAQRMSLGLDLSGGVHFLLEVDMETAVGNQIEAFVGEIQSTFREARFRGYDRNIATDVARGRVTVSFRDEASRDTARALLVERVVDFDVSERTVGERPALRYELRPEALRQFEDYAITQNLQSLRNRVNELGVSEPLVQRLGRERIVIDLPGIQDPARAREILGKVANLEFRLEAASDAFRSEVEAFPYQGREVDLERSIIVTGERVNNAQVAFDPETSLPQVNINLDSQGGKAMADATGPNVGRRMGIVYKEKETRQRAVDDGGASRIETYEVDVERVISLATIQSQLGNRFRITGLSQREASDLSLLLRAGALAAPVAIVEERTVGASLGEANIDAGLTSVIVGFALVLAFMLVYYRVFGLAANVALAVNLVLIAAVMSLLEATLTLPGIAGIVLTVGMAVDANVLIFSRIREELATQSPQQAISAGFDRAFVTILDANVTTFLVAIILYAIGSGPVKGFAVTLAVGIVTSMFTAIVGTRALVNLFYGGRSVQRLAI